MISDYVCSRSNALLQRCCVNQNGNETKKSQYIQKIQRNNGDNKHENNNDNIYNNRIEPIYFNSTLNFQDQNQQKEQEFNIQIQETHKIDRSIFQNQQIIGNSYGKAIICFNDKQGVLFGLDQHAIHERIRYEYFCQLFRQTIFKSDTNQNLKIDSICINLSKKNNEIQYPSIISYDQTQTTCLEIDFSFLQQINENISKINKYNIKIVKISKINQNKFQIFLWPQMRILNEQINYTIQFLNSIIQQENTVIIPEIDYILMFKACKGAIKFNETLGEEQMKILLSNLQICEFPFHCVHGRCSIHTFFSLEQQDICKIQKQYYL